MSCSTEMQAPSAEYVCVFQAGNFHVAAHVSGEQKTFISLRAESDFKVAVKTAILFSELNHIPYNQTLMSFDQPAVTVLKNEGQWFPVRLSADKVTLFLRLGGMSLGGHKPKAMLYAEMVAAVHDLIFYPSVVSLDENTETTKLFG